MADLSGLIIIIIGYELINNPMNVINWLVQQRCLKTGAHNGVRSIIGACNDHAERSHASSVTTYHSMKMA